MPIIEAPRDGDLNVHGDPNTNQKNIRAMAAHINDLEKQINDLKKMVEISNNSAYTAQNLAKEVQEQVGFLRAAILSGGPTE